MSVFGVCTVIVRWIAVTDVVRKRVYRNKRGIRRAPTVRDTQPKR
jgi:hypothetical protein